MVENAGKNIVNYCPIQYIMFAHTRAFGSQFVSYGQIGLHFKQRFALSADLRSLPCLQLLPQKQDQLACPDFHLDPTRAHLAKRAVSVAGLTPFTARKLSYRPLFTETSLITASVTLVETAHGRCVHDIRARHTDR
jgi:hypothetical protein